MLPPNNTRRLVGTETDDAASSHRLHATKDVAVDRESGRQVLLGQTGELVAAAFGAERYEPAADGSFVIPAHGLVRERRVRAHIGGVSRAEGTDWQMRIPLTWAADVESSFVSFDGAVVARPIGPGIRLSITGRFAPPLGAVGSLIAWVVGGRDRLQQVIDTAVERMAAELQRRAERPPDDARPVSGPALLVRDAMATDVIVLDGEADARSCAWVLFDEGITGAPVVDSDGTLVGVLAERDLLIKQASRVYGLERMRDHVAPDDRRTAGQLCSRPAITTHPTASLREAARLMVARNIGRLVVLDGAELVGMLTRHDVLSVFLRGDAELAEAASRALDDEDEAGVHVSVDSGVATLTGRASLRSRVGDLLLAVDHVDGIVGVVDELEWDQDDVLPS